MSVTQKSSMLCQNTGPRQFGGRHGSQRRQSVYDNLSKHRRLMQTLHNCEGVHDIRKCAHDRRERTDLPSRKQKEWKRKTNLFPLHALQLSDGTVSSDNLDMSKCVSLEFARRWRQRNPDECHFWTREVCLEESAASLEDFRESANRLPNVRSIDSRGIISAILRFDKVLRAFAGLSFPLLASPNGPVLLSRVWIRWFQGGGCKDC